MKRITKLFTVVLIISAICFSCFQAYAASFASWQEIRQYVYDSNKALWEYGIEDMDPSYVATPFTNPEYAAIDAKAHELADGLSTEMEKAAAIHKFVAEACYYDYDYYYHGTRPYPPMDPVTVFEDGITVCSGYARLMRVMLRAVGIPARMVVGTAYSGYSLDRASSDVLLRDSNHDWIEAYLDGEWRFCDPTWDSNNYFEYGEKHFNTASDWYFCDDLADFSRSHFAIGYYDELKIGDFIVSADVDEKTVCGAADGVTLTSVVIPEGTTRIRYNAFKDCKTLESVSLPETLTSIGSSAFSGCSALTSIEIPDSVTDIESSAFAGCSALTSAKLSAGLTELSNFAFKGCSALASVEIPDGVKNIKGEAFSGCSALTSIDLPGSVTKIGSKAFAGCSSLTAVTGGENVTSVADYAFKGCGALTAITLPADADYIGKAAFADCTSLTAAFLPDGYTDIAAYTFSGCSSVTSMYIPAGIIAIPEYFASGCDALTDIYWPGTEAQWNALSIAEGNEPLLGATLHAGHEHGLTETVVTAATCTEKGSVIRACGDCGLTLNAKTDALGHSYEIGEGATATCTEAGDAILTCSVCGDVKEITGQALGHDLALTAKTDATCDADGSETYACTRCDYTETKDIPGGHKYTSITVAPSCTDQGYTLFTCSVCKDEYTENVQDALDHNYEVTDQKAATCTEDGYTVQTCSRCGDTITDTVASSGHDYVESVSPSACENGGYVIYTCSVCGDTYTGAEIEATGHKDDNNDGWCDVCKKELSPHYTEADLCAYCGEYHGNTFFEVMIALFHRIMYFFNKLTA